MDNYKINDVLFALRKSDFRNSFHLKEKDKKYVQEKGMDTILEHTYNFINNRIAPKVIENDGKQTPTKGHPVFIAQHATACCCRGCIEKWHHIPKGRAFNKSEIDYIADVIMTWIWREMG